MDNKIDSLLSRVTDFASHRKGARYREEFAVIRRSLESIKLEISLGTPIDLSVLEKIEVGIARLEQRAK